jgi:hypothetical protein
MRWRICLHESGHGLAHHACGNRVISLELFPDRPIDNPRWGRCGGLTSAHIRGWSTDFAGIDESLVSLCGPAAECVFLHRCVIGADHERAEKALKSTGMSFDRAWQGALMLVENHRAVIARVARALYRAHRLDEGDFLYAVRLWDAPRWGSNQ